MKISNLHSITGIILLSSMLFFSSGFTAIVKFCTMSKCSECCCESDESGNSAAPEKEQPGIQSPSCLTIKIVGGLNDIKAAGPTDVSEKMLAINSTPLLAVAEPLPVPVPNTFLHQTNGVGPPKEEIYIRVGSLLI